jgi:Predicted membrane protein (DUF2142)
MTRPEPDNPRVLGESKAFTNARESILIGLLCFAAALHVFIFSAAFPFFSNVDEYLHFDLITQYSRGHVPRSFDRLEEEALDWIVPYASPEFLSPPEEFQNGRFPTPLWKQSGPEVDPVMAATRAAWSGQVNFESSQPPVYYALASTWWWVGKRIGFAGLESLYWIRFLNALLIAIVVWMGYVTARTIAPERMELRIGVPLLLAFIPQNVFFTVNNDVLSPVCFGMLFLLVLQWLRVETYPVWLGATTGLAIAATYLTKLSNLPFIGVAVLVIAVKLSRATWRASGSGLTQLVALLVCAAIPIGGWMVWNKVHFGDLTGSTAKILLLGWSRKPIAAWWQHPIFTPNGLWVFWSSLMASFWRGEHIWHGRFLKWKFVDWFFAISSLVLLLSAIKGIARQSAFSTFQRQAIASAILVWLAGIFFLALLSIQFDFGESTGPTRVHPYFTAGRLLSGALIPFALTYVSGIAFLLRRAKGAVLPLSVIVGIVVVIALSEITVNHVVFASEHNWFHR